MNSVLIVDSDGNALAAQQRKLRHTFQTRIALGARQGLQMLVENGPFAVVIAEFSMPEMDGISFLAKVSDLSPASARILVSHETMDSPDLLRAINEARVFQLLASSCEGAMLTQVVHEGMDRFARIMAATQEMNAVHAVFAKAVHEIVCWLRTDVRDMISPILPVLRGVCQRTSDPAPVLTETALLLSVIGLLAMPSEILPLLSQGEPLSDEQHRAFAAHPTHTVELMRHLPQLREIGDVLLGYAHMLHTRQGASPEELAQIEAMPHGARVLALVMEYRLLGLKGLEQAAIFNRLGESRIHSRQFLGALWAQLASMDISETEMSLDKLCPGMVMAQAVRGERDGNEVVLVPQGYELSRTTILFLRQAARQGQVREPLLVLRSSVSLPIDSENA